MTNCCGDYHYSDCPSRTGASDRYDDYDHFEAWVDQMEGADDEPSVDDDGPLWNEDAAMESSLFGDC